ncbi:MAG: FHA domain-containing protein [Bacteroidales bacterium]|nr:FHA domain-containing protein [Bacteroidales bacterium]
MKRILTSIFIVLFSPSVFSQQIIQVGESDVSEYPTIKFTVNYYNNSQIDESNIKLINKGLDVPYTLNVTPHLGASNKQILFIIEDLTHYDHNGQREFYRNLLTGTINNFVNDSDKVNIAIFDRTRDGNKLLRFLSNNYTNDATNLISKLNSYSNPSDAFNNKQGSDLYQAIYDGLEDLHAKFPDGNAILVVFSAGYNNQYSNNYDPGTLKDLSNSYKIPIYMIQYERWEHRTLKTFIESTYGSFLYTKDLDDAQSKLTDFMNNAVTKLLGYDYNFSFETDKKPDGKLYSVNVEIESSTQTISFTPKCSDFICWIKHKFYIPLAALVVIIILIFVLIKMSKKNKKSFDDIKIQQDEQVQTIQGQLQNSHNQLNNAVDQKLKDSQFEIENLKNEREREKQELLQKENQKQLDLQRKINEQNLIGQMKRLGQFPRISADFEGNSYNFEINKPELSFGRQDADYVINNQYISRLHFKIIFEDNNYYIVNLSTTNPTIINGTAINGKTLLNDRDLIIVGPIGLNFFK